MVRYFDKFTGRFWYYSSCHLKCFLSDVITCELHADFESCRKHFSRILSYFKKFKSFGFLEVCPSTTLSCFKNIYRRCQMNESECSIGGIMVKIEARNTLRITCFLAIFFRLNSHNVLPGIEPDPPWEIDG